MNVQLKLKRENQRTAILQNNKIIEMRVVVLCTFVEEANQI